MTWVPYFIGIFALLAFAFLMNYGLDQKTYRNTVKSIMSQKPLLVMALVVIVLAIPFSIIYFQN